MSSEPNKSKRLAPVIPPAKIVLYAKNVNPMSIAPLPEPTRATIVV